jgi:urease accessory protein
MRRTITVMTTAMTTHMGTATTTTTETAAPGGALLRLMQLASPALPVGGFSYSEALEAAVHSGAVLDEATAGDWLLDQLGLNVERSDLPLLAQALPAWRCGDLARIRQLNDWANQTRETAEQRLQTQQTGRSLAVWLKRHAPADARVSQLETLPPAPAWPVAFALAGVHSGAALHDVLLAFGFGWAENMVQAAMRAVPLGQSAAQRMLARLIDALPDAAVRAAAIDDDARQAFTPMLAILSAQHELQYSRLFRS